MRSFQRLILFVTLALCGCTSLQRAAHMYSSDSPQPHSFEYRDGGSSTYYSFQVGDAAAPDTLVFFYGGSGCPSWKSVMPGYLEGLNVNAHVFALNKRYVPDRSTGLFDCGQEFHLANNPDQWVADYSEFIEAQRRSTGIQPKNIVLVGVSEGGLPAIRIAGRSPAVTHLAILGYGGYSMRQSLATLKQKGSIPFDIEAGWKKISTEPRSLEKKWFGNPYRWWSDITDIDPLPELLELDIPILVGIGQRDESVPVESVQFLDAKFKERGKNNLIVRIYPGADHRLNAGGVSYRSTFFAELGRLLQRISPDKSPEH